MFKNVVLAGLFVSALATPSLASTYSQQQCKAWFTKIDRNGDGTIGANEGADKFLARITLASENDGSRGTFIMQRSFFIAECNIGSLGKPQA
jgi:hypothetical protein